MDKQGETYRTGSCGCCSFFFNSLLMTAWACSTRLSSAWTKAPSCWARIWAWVLGAMMLMMMLRITSVESRRVRGSKCCQVK